MRCVGRGIRSATASRARDADRRSVAGARCEANGRAPASARTVAGRAGVARGRVRMRASQGWRPRRSRRTSWIHRAFGHSERVLGVFMSVCNYVHLRDFGRNQTCAGALWNVSENILRRSARSHLEISARSSPRGRRLRPRLRCSMRCGHKTECGLKLNIGDLARGGRDVHGTWE